MDRQLIIRLMAVGLAAGTLLFGCVPGRATQAPPMVIQNRFGGPSYFGAPALDVTAAFIKAGGGAGSFSTVRAFSSMIGDTVLQSELAKLRTRFGARATDRFVHVFDFAMSDAWKRA